ncbi:MAG: helix-turn-helix domain-containing protein [Faecalibacterium sp.]
MELSNICHYTDNILTQAEARLELSDNRVMVTWYTNQYNEQSVVHSHPYHEMVFPIGGSKVRYSVNGSVYLVSVGQFIYFPAQMYHSGVFNITGPVSDRLVIQIDDSLWQSSRRNANLMGVEWMHDVTVLDEAACSRWDMRGLILRMAQSAGLHPKLRDLVFGAQVAELLLLVTQITGSGQTRAPSSTSELVARAVAYLQAHYQEPGLTTSQLAQELYASREHLSRAFKECTMESIHGYLTHLRMQHCRRALAEGASVLSACTESGFPDYSSFLKTFRRMYGVTPAEYRAQYRRQREQGERAGA